MKSQFQLKIPKNSSRILLVFSMSLLLLLLFSLIFYQRWNAFQGGLSQGVGLSLVVFILVILLFSTWHLFRQYESDSVALSFNEKEWKDSVSLLGLGLRPLSDIQNLQVKTMFGFDVLEVHLRPEGLRENGAGVLRSLYTSLLGHRLLIPLFFLDVSRLDLESQFYHLQSLMGSEDSSDFKSSFNKSSVGTGAPSKKWEQKKGDSELKGFFSRVSGEKAQQDDSPPGHPVLQKVAERKREFQSRGLDHLVCELFYDYLRNLPEWTEHRSAKVPEGLSLVGRRQEEHDYEEVDFNWLNQSFQMGLRTNLGENNAALLSLACQGEVKVNLKVGVEIGTLDPRELERYIKGPWEEALFELERAFKKPLTKAPESEGSPEIEGNSPEIADLKKNFGLGEDES